MTYNLYPYLQIHKIKVKLYYLNIIFKINIFTYLINIVSTGERGT